MKVTLKALKSKDTDFEPEALGEHIRRIRLSRQLSQNNLAQIVGACASTILNWEKEKTEPPVESMPAILAFLGYNPFPEPKTLAERMLAKRRAMGWTIAEAAKQLGVDEGTWGQWEASKAKPRGRYHENVQRFLQ